MDIKECYKEMGADYEDVLRRMGSDSLVERFTLRFLDDKSYQMIKDGIAAGDAETAFRGAHTLKGVCLNLGFSSLYEVSAQLTEDLRGRVIEGSEASQAAVDKPLRSLSPFCSGCAILGRNITITREMRF